MATKRKNLAALSPEDELFKNMPPDVQRIQRTAKAMRRGKQREEFAQRMLAGPETLGNKE